MDQHVARPRRTFVALGTMAVSAIALVGAFPGAADATGGDRHGRGGSGHPEHPCPDEGWDFHWGPQNQHEVPGEHTDGDFTVTISNVRNGDEGKTFDFETSVPVDYLFAVGYPYRDEGVVHEYDPPVTSETAWTGDPKYIKHVYFCPGEEEQETTTTSESTTTTEAPEETTTTEAPEETTTTEAPEETTTTEAPTTAPPTSEAPTTAPPTTEAISDEELPRTGSTTMPLVAGAGALVALGVALVAGKRFMQQRG